VRGCFTKTLAKELSLNIKFASDKTETQSIGSATRNWRILIDKDVNVIRRAIKASEKEKYTTNVILSTDEVTEIIEKDLEQFIEANPGLVGASIKSIKRQLNTDVGRIDLLIENKKGNLIIVELKLNKIGRDAISQLRRYMNWVKKETDKEVRGLLICKGVMPAFEKEFKKLNNIKIFCYGWELKIFPWKK